MSTGRLVLVAAVASVALVGCSAQPGDVAPVVQSPEPTAETLVFQMPTACADTLPDLRVAVLEDAGLILLSGPDGLYSDDYLAESTPEQDVGGITCIWGDDSTEISSVTISVAPLDSETAPLIEDQLRAQNLNEAISDDGVEFGEAGDEDGSAAIYNVLRDDSWISVIETVGGEDAFERAVLIAGEVYASVYK